MMFWPRGGCLTYSSTNFLSLFHNVSNIIWTTLILQLQVSFDVCAHIPSTLWVSTFYMNPWYSCNNFATIAWDVNFHMGQEQLHALLSIMFNSSRWQVDIVFTKDGIHTLIDIVIADLIRVDLFPQSCVTQRFVVFYVVQTKEQNYHDQHPANQFFPLTMEIFGCLHK